MTLGTDRKLIVQQDIFKALDSIHAKACKLREESVYYGIETEDLYNDLIQDLRVKKDEIEALIQNTINQRKSPEG